MDWRPLVVTGPTGWIGSALLAVVARERGPGWAETVRLFGSSERPIVAPDGTSVPMRALASIGGGDVAGADIVHLAYLTKEKVDTLGERAFFAANMAIDDALLAACGASPPHGLFVASSGAAALAQDGRDRHLYGIMKLLQEDRFLAWGGRAGVPVTAARIFNIAGPHINKVSSYAIASFLSQALNQGSIRIEARIPVYRAYLHVDDLARLALALLDKGLGAPHPVDFCGSEIVEMRDIARAALAEAGLPEESFVRPPIDHATSSAYLGDPVSMRTLALRCGIELAPFHRQVHDTATFLRR